MSETFKPEKDIATSSVFGPSIRLIPLKFVADLLRNEGPASLIVLLNEVSDRSEFCVSERSAPEGQPLGQIASG